MPRPASLRFTLISARGLPLKGASALARAGSGLLLVEDDTGIYRLRGAKATLWAGPDVHPALADLEAIATDEAGGVVWALAEESGVLVELSGPPRPPRIRRVATLARPGHKSNKGFEGLAYLPARHSPSRRAALVAAHEGKPRRLCVFDRATLAPVHNFKLPKEAKHALDDLADVAVDPVTGALVVLSQQSRCLGVLEVDGDHLRLRGTFELPLKGKERPEGLGYLASTRLAVATEGPARLLELRVQRRAQV
jgi:hypothetical protein